MSRNRAIKREFLENEIADESYTSDDSLSTIVFLIIFSAVIQYILIKLYTSPTNPSDIYLLLILCFAFLFILCSCFLFIIFKRRIYELATVDSSHTTKGIVFNKTIRKYTILFSIKEILPYENIKKWNANENISDNARSIHLITHANEDFYVNRELYEQIQKYQCEDDYVKSISPVIRYRACRILFSLFLLNSVYILYLIYLVY